MFLELGIHSAQHRRRLGIGIEHQHGVYVFAVIGCRADNRRILDAAGRSKHTLDVLRKTLSPSGVTMTSFLRPRTVSRPDASNEPMSPVWNQPS